VGGSTTATKSRPPKRNGRRGSDEGPADKKKKKFGGRISIIEEDFLRGRGGDSCGER